MLIGLMIFLFRVSVTSCIIVGITLYVGKSTLERETGALHVDRPIMAIASLIIMVGIVLLFIGFKSEMR